MDADSQQIAARVDRQQRLYVTPQALPPVACLLERNGFGYPGRMCPRYENDGGQKVQVLQNISIRARTPSEGTTQWRNVEDAPGACHPLRCYGPPACPPQRGYSPLRQYELVRGVAGGRIVITGMTPPAAPLPPAGQLPMARLDDYPELAFTLHAFGSAHRRRVTQLAAFLRASFNALLASSTAYVLLIGVDYERCVCAEVETRSLGAFIARLLARLLDVRHAPFVLEVKHAPANWASALKKSIVVGAHNLELAARRIAECFLADDAPQQQQQQPLLDLQFFVRRGCMRVQVRRACDPPETIFQEACGRILSRGECCVDAATQTTSTSVAPARFIELHRMQAELVALAARKTTCRLATLFDHVHRLESRVALADALLVRSARLAHLHGSSRNSWRRRPARQRVSRQTQTQSMSSSSEEAPTWPSFDDFGRIVHEVITFSAKHFQRLQMGLRRVERDTRLLKLELAQKKNAPLPADTSSSPASMQVVMMAYLAGYERILSRFKIPRAASTEASGTRRKPDVGGNTSLTLSDGDISYVENLFSLDDLDLVPLDAFQNLIEFCTLGDGRKQP